MPALLVSTAAGITVTRASSGSHLEPKWFADFGQRRTMMHASGVLLVLGLFPACRSWFSALWPGGLSDLAPSRGPARSHGPGTAGSGAGSEWYGREAGRHLIGLDTLELESGHGCCGSSSLDKGGELPVGSPTCVGRLPGHGRDHSRGSPAGQPASSMATISYQVARRGSAAGGLTSTDSWFWTKSGQDAELARFSTVFPPRNR